MSLGMASSMSSGVFSTMLPIKHAAECAIKRIVDHIGLDSERTAEVTASLNVLFDGVTKGPGRLYDGLPALPLDSQALVLRPQPTLRGRRFHRRRCSSADSVPQQAYAWSEPRACEVVLLK